LLRKYAFVFWKYGVFCKENFNNCQSGFLMKHSAPLLYVVAFCFAFIGLLAGFASCLENVQKLPDTTACELADSLRMESFAHYKKKKYGAADSLARLAAHHALAGGCVAAWAKARCEVARVIRATDSAQSAIDSLMKDLAWVEQFHPDIAGFFHFQIAFNHGANLEYYNALLHYEKARESYEQGLRSITKLPGQFLYKPLANIYTRLGDNEKAVSLLKIALDSSMHHRDTVGILKISGDLGIAYNDAKAFQLACEQYQTGLRYLQQYISDGGQYDEQTYLFSNWALAMLSLAQPDSAQILAQHALDHDPENPDAFLILGEIEAQRGHFALADGYFRKAEEICRADSPPLNRELAKILLRRSALLAERNPADPVPLRLCNEALTFVLPKFQPNDALENPTPKVFYPENTILEALNLKSEILWRRYQQGENDLKMLLLADTTTALALNSADVLTTTYGFASSVLYSVEYTRNLHERYFQILFERHERLKEPETPARIVAFSERSRALLLRQKLAGEVALQNARLPSDLLEKEKLLRAEIVEQKNLLAEMEADGESVSDIEQQKRRIFRLEDERQRLMKGHAASNAQSDTVAAISLAGIQAQLPSDSAMLVEFFYNPESGTLYQIGITRSEVRTARHSLALKNIEAFIAFVRDGEAAKARAETEPDYRSDFTRESRMLYDSLLAQVVGNLPLTEMIVVPDGVLGAFPFDLLLPNAAEGTTFRNLPYLFTRTAVRFAPSATVLFQPKYTTRRAPSADYLGIAPIYHSKTFEFVEFGDGCVTALGGLFCGKTLRDTFAAPAAFRGQAGNYRIVHFYGHGRADNVQPNRSYLAFTSLTKGPVAQQKSIVEKKSVLLVVAPQLPSEEVSNVFYAHEISLMQLSADLVVLSACETGVGKAVGGEGVLSLARAFQDAGCPSAAMTLWSVDDEATAQLTRLFLQHIRDGKRKDVALQLAKKDFLASGQPAAPFFWSGFVLTGDAAPVEFGDVCLKGAAFSYAAILGLVVMLVLVLGLILRIFLRK